MEILSGKHCVVQVARRRRNFFRDSLSQIAFFKPNVEFSEFFKLRRRVDVWLAPSARVEKSTQIRLKNPPGAFGAGWIFGWRLRRRVEKSTLQGGKKNTGTDTSVAARSE